MTRFLIAFVCVLAGLFTIAVPLVWLIPEVPKSIAIGYTMSYIFAIIGYVIGSVINRVLEGLGKR